MVSTPPPSGAGVQQQNGQQMVPGTKPPGGPQDQTPSMQVMLSMQQKQNRVSPVEKPQGLDPITLLSERENR